MLRRTDRLKFLLLPATGSRYEGSPNGPFAWALPTRFIGR